MNSLPDNSVAEMQHTEGLLCNESFCLYCCRICRLNNSTIENCSQNLVNPAFTIQNEQIAITQCSLIRLMNSSKNLERLSGYSLQSVHLYCSQLQIALCANFDDELTFQSDASELETFSVKRELNWLSNLTLKVVDTTEDTGAEPIMKINGRPIFPGANMNFKTFIEPLFDCLFDFGKTYMIKTLLNLDNVATTVNNSMTLEEIIKNPYIFYSSYDKHN